TVSSASDTPSPSVSSGGSATMRLAVKVLLDTLLSVNRRTSSASARNVWVPGVAIQAPPATPASQSSTTEPSGGIGLTKPSDHTQLVSVPTLSATRVATPAGVGPVPWFFTTTLNVVV